MDDNAPLGTFRGWAGHLAVAPILHLRKALFSSSKFLTLTTMPSLTGHTSQYQNISPLNSPETKMSQPPFFCSPSLFSPSHCLFFHSRTTAVSQLLCPRVMEAILMCRFVKKERCWRGMHKLYPFVNGANIDTSCNNAFSCSNVCIKMGDGGLNSLMVCYIEKELLGSICDEKIIK